MNTLDLDALLVAADRAARAGGEIVRAHFGSPPDVREKAPGDWVTAADLASETAVREVLERETGLAVFGEEFGGDRADTCWLVDPLDGTANFLFGLPQWAVSIAVEDEHGVLAGVVYDPPRGELWAATRDGDATLDGTPLRGSRRDELATALVATGFGYDAEVRRAQAATIAALLPEVRDVRRFGAAALDLAWCAAGRFDAYYERGVKHWDIAAGGLLCERAGLVVETLAPAPPQEAGILVAAPALMSLLRTRVSG